MTPRELPKEVLERGAVVYIRQSTRTQVQENLESQRRQYELVDLARGYGFRDVAVIDADLGRSASGTIDRPVRHEEELRHIVGDRDLPAFAVPRITGRSPLLICPGNLDNSNHEICFDPASECHSRRYSFGEILPKPRVL